VLSARSPCPTTGAAFRLRSARALLQTNGRHTAHQHYPSEVPIRYRFHPLRGSSFFVIRLHYVHEEPCYVIRRANGLPLSIPVWMTEPAAAQIEIVREPRVALPALVELRRLATAYLCSLTSTDSEGSHDATARGKTGAAIRGQQFCSRTATSNAGSTTSNPRTRPMDESAGEGDGREGER